MAKKKHQEQGRLADEEVRPELPPGVKLLRTLEGHRRRIFSMEFDPLGGTLASGSADNTVKLWEAHSGKLLRTLEGHTSIVDIVTFSADGRLLAFEEQRRHDPPVELRLASGAVGLHAHLHAHGPVA